ncbi:hypothetical protein [Atopobium fossor]|uniref:hypothetical protein n=1 Tax=Atopobium fossor TaxID=39487 RepID=UPI000415A1FB|nr:hypothetical protein [Atopobium fossor]
MKSVDLKRGFVYRYAVYRMSWYEKRSTFLRDMPSQEKEELYECVGRQTVKAVLLFAPLYLMGNFLLFHYLWRISDSNAFAAWVCETLFAAIDIIQGDWGYGWPGKRRVVLLVVWQLLPVVPIIVLPLAVFTALMVEVLVRHAIKRR